jgi:STE24 endopeptidase
MAAGSNTFDPAVETAKYLATLPPEAHAKATAYTQGGHWLLLWGAVVAIVVAWLIVKSGILVKVRAGVERKKPRPWLAVLAVLPLGVLLETLLNLPWLAYSDWWRNTSYGMTSQAFGGWLGEWAINLAISLVALTLVMSALYALIRIAPKRWWLWGGAVSALFLIVFMVLAPIYILPLFNTYTPAPQGPVRDAVVEMAKANGVPHDKIFVFNGSKQSNRYTANVSGLFGSAQVNMSDTMFKAGADMSEIRAVVGHEMGHYARGHILWMVGGFALLLMLGFWLMGKLFPLACRLLGAHNVKGIGDPAGYPVFSLLLTLLLLLATPVMNSIIRLEETDADNFSLRVANEPDGLAKALIQTVEYRAATPGLLEEIIFYDHPSVSRRIRNGMEWKAAHPPAEAKPAPAAPKGE